MTLDLATQLKALNLPFQQEVVFSPSRKWRADFIVSGVILVEIDGGQYVPGGGRHNRPKGYQADCEKLNEAEILGFTVLRVTPADVASGRAITWIERAIKARM
jgi:very-short-patch-repair endonuclease